MDMKLPTDEEIRALDDELTAEGAPAQRRPLLAVWRWATRIGATPTELPEDAARWFIEKFSELHPSVDFRHQPFSFLCASARGISYELNPPVGFGRGRFDPLDWVKIGLSEKKRIFDSDPNAYWDLYYQAADGIDLFMGALDLHPKQGDATQMLSVGTDQLEGSARQLVAGVVDSSLSQAACLAAETILKAVLHEQGIALPKLQKIGHKIPALCLELSSIMPGPNDKDFVAVANSMPAYVAVRYSPPAATIAKLQSLYARTLFLCAEALRRTRHDQLYYKLLQDQSVPPRIWQW